MYIVLSFAFYYVWIFSHSSHVKHFVLCILLLLCASWSMQNHIWCYASKLCLSLQQIIFILFSLLFLYLCTTFYSFYYMHHITNTYYMDLFLRLAFIQLFILFYSPHCIYFMLYISFFASHYMHLIVWEKYMFIFLFMHLTIYVSCYASLSIYFVLF